MTNDKTKLSEIKRPSPVFCNRLAGKEHWIGDVCFKLQALPRTVEMYLQSCARIDKDEAVVLIHRLRLGTGARGLVLGHGPQREPLLHRGDHPEERDAPEADLLHHRLRRILGEP